MANDKFKDILDGQDEEDLDDDGDDGQNDSCCDDDSITTEEVQVRENSTMTAVFLLWKEATLVDFTIKIEDRLFKVHKVILASMSDYFKVMLTGSMAESQTNMVDLSGALTIDSMEIVLEFIYTNKIEITKNNVRGILRVANYLQMQKLIDKCTNIIVDRVLWSANCFEILTEFKNYALTGPMKDVKDYIRRNRDTITKDIDVQKLSCEEISALAEAWEESEMKLFHFLVEWIQNDPECRDKHWNELMTQVRFGLLSPSDIDLIKILINENHKRYHFDGPWCDLVETATEYHELPAHKKVLDTSLQTQVRAEPSLHAFSRDVTESPGFYVNSNSSRWIADEQLTLPEDGVVAYSVTVVNNFLVVFIDQNKVYKWLIFDPRTLKWSEMAQMPTEREGFAIAHHDKHLYTIGGSILHPFSEPPELLGPYPEREEYIVTDIVERYDFDNNTWSACTKLPLVVRDNAACFFGDTLYNSGGRQSVEDPDRIEEEYPGISRVDCFNLSKQRWESKAPMLETRGRHLMSVMTLHREKVICVVDRVLQVEHYSPSTDQWTRCWEFNFTKKFPPLYPRNIWIANGNSVYMIDINLRTEMGIKACNPDGAVKLTFPEKDISLKAPVEFFSGFPFRKKETIKTLCFPEDSFPICTLLAVQRDAASFDQPPGNKTMQDDTTELKEPRDSESEGSEPEDSEPEPDFSEPEFSEAEDMENGGNSSDENNGRDIGVGFALWLLDHMARK